MIHAVFIGDVTCNQFDVVLDAQPSDVVKIGIAVPFDQTINSVTF
jgi:bifunctional DNase/RNase